MVKLGPTWFAETIPFQAKYAFGPGIHRCMGSQLARPRAERRASGMAPTPTGWPLKPGINLKSSIAIRMVDSLERV